MVNRGRHRTHSFTENGLDELGTVPGPEQVRGNLLTPLIRPTLPQLSGEALPTPMAGPSLRLGPFCKWAPQPSHLAKPATPGCGALTMGGTEGLTGVSWPGQGRAVCWEDCVTAAMAFRRGRWPSHCPAGQ